VALPHPEADPFDDLDAFSDKAARDIERQMNIHRLKNEAQNIAGGEMTTFESPDLPPEVSEQFWRNVVEFERAPRVSMKSKLDDAGIEMPPVDQLSDEELPARLWQVIEFFAAQNTFLSDTNHLSDRELYEFLREQAFDSSMPDFPSMNCHLSPIGSCDEDDMIINFRFFADDEARERWMKQFPDYQMPARETAPFDRDRLLPQADYSRTEDDEKWDDEDFEGEDDEEGIPRL